MLNQNQLTPNETAGAAMVGTPSKPSTWRTSRIVLLAVGLAVWLGASVFLGANGHLAADSDVPFRPILLSIAVPVAVFLALYARSTSFRAFILSRDMRFVTSLQQWRVVGFAFILLYVEGVLPGLFAWPAAAGDVAIGLTTPLVLLALARSEGFATSRAFVAWNVLGLFDFVIAGAAATLASGAVPALLSGSPTSAPMEVWPLILFPSFIVPLFVFAHLTILFQVRALRLSQGPQRLSGGGPRGGIRPAARGEAPAFLAIATSEPVLRRSFVLALAIGAGLVLVNQRGAIFGPGAIDFIAMALSFTVPFVVISISQALGAGARFRAAGTAEDRSETMFATAAGHRIPARAALVAAAVGSILTLLTAGLIWLRTGDPALAPAAQIVQGFALPFFFGMVSQAAAYRRAGVGTKHRQSKDAAPASAYG